jgi:hypothetical protein
MAVGTLSVEATIRHKLEQLNCPENAFVVFNGVVARTRFFEAMRGVPGKHFNQEDAEKLFHVINQMEQLQAASVLPIAWARIVSPDTIETAILLQRIRTVAEELNFSDVRDAAARAVEATIGSLK